jgi:hypothetical protein
MKHPILLRTALAVLTLLLNAPATQAQSCIGEMKPLKPVAANGKDATVTCLCDDTGLNCHYTWIWSPATPRSTAPARRSEPPAGIDTSIYRNLQPIQTPDLMGNALQILMMRNLIEQNRALEQRNRTTPPAALPAMTPGSFIPDDWQAKIEAARQHHPDYDQAVERSVAEGLIVTPPMHMEIAESGQGAEILYYLATHPDECRRIAEATKLPAKPTAAQAGTAVRTAAREIGRIEERIATVRQ